MTARAIILALLLAGCSRGEDAGPDRVPADASTRPTDEVVRLEVPAEPMSWTGTLPCADCAGIRTTLTLRGDGTYRRSDAYLGTGERGDTLFTSVGRWLRMDSETPTLALRSEPDGPQPFQALAGGALRFLDREGRPIDSDLPHRLEPTSDPRHAGRFRAMVGFVYFADAALAVTCEGGLQLPVAMEGAYLALERAYAAAGYAGPAPMPVRISGALEERPAMDGGGQETVVVVDGHDPAADLQCPALDLPAALAGTWRWASLHREQLPSDGPAPTLTRDPVEGLISGDAGCNRFSGTAALRGSLLVTGPLAVTRMFCQGGMELEARVLQVLEAGGWLALEDGTLVLRQGPEEVARFELVTERG